MRSDLEKSITALLNENEEAATQLFHNYLVNRAREIHEANRAGEDFVLDQNWDQEIVAENYFTEADLAALEDDADEAGEEAADLDAEADLEAGDDLGAEADLEAGADLGAEADLDAGVEGEEEAADDLEADLDVDASELDIEEGIMSKLEDLISRLEDTLDGIAGDEIEASFGDLEAGDKAGEEDAGEVEEIQGDFEADEDGAVDADAVSDDMEGADGDEEEEEEDDFKDITESVLDELEAIQCKLTDGKEIGADGKSVPASKPSEYGKARDKKAEPVVAKGPAHQGFERENAKAPATLKARKNNVARANDAFKKV